SFPFRSAFGLPVYVAVSPVAPFSTSLGMTNMNDKRLFFRFRHGFFGRLKADFGMRAVAKWFFSRRAAAAERHSFFDRKSVAVSVDQFYFTRYDVGTILDCFDCYLSHVLILLSCRPKWRHLLMFLK